VANRTQRKGRSVEKCVFACKANERSACEQAAMLRYRKPERAVFNMPSKTLTAVNTANQMFTD
jgi:hypothetical protein